MLPLTGNAGTVETLFDDGDKVVMAILTGYELSEVESSVCYGLCDDSVSGIAVGFKICLRPRSQNSRRRV